MSIAQNFPEIRPSLNLDFANVKALDPRVTFSRASSATYYGTQTAKAEENLLIRSQEFDNGAWTKSNVTVTANSTTAPDGTSTADKITPTTLNGFHIVYYLVQNTTLNTSSIFVKASELSKIAIRDSWDGTAYASFDLTTETVLVESQGTGSINSVGNGWYRLSFTLSSAQNYAFAIIPLLDSYTSGNPFLSYAGDGISGIFIWGAQLEQRSSVTAYTPTTTQPITNYIPVLETAPANTARFDHDPVTGESLGLLVEEQRTNLLRYSEDFGNAAWNKDGVTVSANQVIAPDGTLTMDKLTEDTSTGLHLVQYIISGHNNTTFSIFAKLAIGSRTLTFNNGGAKTSFSLVGDGSVISSTANTISASIKNVGNGVYKCSVSVASITTSQVTVGLSQATSSTQGDSYTGDGVSGIYIWGASLEAGSFPTSYIKTEASQVTRSSDSASMTGANFSGFYNQAEGTMYAEANLQTAGSRFVVSDNTNSNRIMLDGGTTTSRIFITANGALQANIPLLYVLGDFTKTVAVYANNSANIAQDGTLGAEDTSVIVPVVDRLYIGAGATGNVAFANGHICKLSYYPQRLSDVQLQGLTS